MPTNNRKRLQGKLYSVKYKAITYTTFMDGGKNKETVIRAFRSERSYHGLVKNIIWSTP